ncbi:MAG: primosomal protein N' (replication factor Y) - superfamily II helicase [Yoonia sp.]
MTTEHRFPCDTCGSDLRFDPGQHQLQCDHCGNVQPIEGSRGMRGGIKELDFRTAVANQLDEEEIEVTTVTTRPNCGATTEFDADMHAAECPFCATPVVTDTGAHRHIKPRGLLPFAMDESAARVALNGWLGSLWFAPSGLMDCARKGRKMNGIYVPYWTFDADTRSKYRGQRGTHYYETKTITRDGKRQQVRVRRTRWHAASGRVARFFDDVLVLASKSLPKKYTDGLEPWDLSALEPYKPDYLAGFRAEGYQVELVDGFDEARDYMDRMILRDVKYDIGGDEQRVMDVDTSVGDVTFKHILLPVWLAAYKYRGRTFRFVVNGRTGRVQGERPYSAWKITFAVIIGLIIALIAEYVIANSQ